MGAKIRLIFTTEKVHLTQKMLKLNYFNWVAKLLEFRLNSVKFFRNKKVSFFYTEIVEMELFQRSANLLGSRLECWQKIARNIFRKKKEGFQTGRQIY